MTKNTPAEELAGKNIAKVLFASTSSWGTSKTSTRNAFLKKVDHYSQWASRGHVAMFVVTIRNFRQTTMTIQMALIVYLAKMRITTLRILQLGLRLVTLRKSNLLPLN